MLKMLGLIFYLELVLRLRRSQEWLYPLAFFVIVISLFPLTFTPDPAFLQKFIPGCVWIAALFASLLSIQTIFFSDMEDGHLEQLLLERVSLTLFIHAKCAAQWVVTALPLILLTPLIGFLFQLSTSAMTTLTLSLLLGTPILILICSLGMALTLGLKQQGVLLGLLILPLVTPILIFGVNVVQQSQAGFAIAGTLAFLAGLTVLAITLLPWAIAASLRASMDD